MKHTGYCAGPAYYRMCSTDVYCSKQHQVVAPKENHHPSFLRFWNWAEENCRCSQKFVAAQKIRKNRNSANIRKWIARFHYWYLYSAGSACVLLTILYGVAHRYGQLYLHCSLIYFWVPSSCFCIVISLLRVK